MSVHLVASSLADDAPGANLAAAFTAPTVASVVGRAEKMEPLNIAFLGGSLTWGANASDPNKTSYRGRMMQWLREKYPHTPFTFQDAAIGGTGSDLALFRLDRDVLACKPDLVFLDFTVNDDIGGTDVRRLVFYERVLRELRASGAAVLPVLMSLHAQISAPDGAPLPARYAAHQKLADFYGLPVADTLRTARKAVADGRCAADALYPFGQDRTHPDDSGYELFFEAVRDAWLRAAQMPEAAPIPPATLYPDLFPRWERRVLVQTTLPSGWKREKTRRTSMWFDGLSSRWMGDVAAASAGAAPLETTFRGSFVALFGERDRLTAPFRVWIDGRPIPQPGAKGEDALLWKIDTARMDSPTSAGANLFAWTPLANELTDDEHSLKIAPVFAADSPHSQASQLRIESLCSAGR